MQSSVIRFHMAAWGTAVAALRWNCYALIALIEGSIGNKKNELYKMENDGSLN
ncbi:hypothetical protein TIFTF001_019970 [Ficus carica]|uniref:Uncharacterized protein n=1 Tax=Ficus carica TaxID=3494 RepID=A0AA88DDA0_FICCA|nr:hypothetical protein TIFTF001_019970 [Ficus carica]